MSHLFLNDLRETFISSKDRLPQTDKRLDLTWIETRSLDRLRSHWVYEQHGASSGSSLTNATTVQDSNSLVYFWKIRGSEVAFGAFEPIAIEAGKRVEDVLERRMPSAIESWLTFVLFAMGLSWTDTNDPRDTWSGHLSMPLNHLDTCRHISPLAFAEAQSDWQGVPNPPDWYVHVPDLFASSSDACRLLGGQDRDAIARFAAHPLTSPLFGSFSEDERHLRQATHSNISATQNQSKIFDSSDGPIEPDGFRWGGNTIYGLTPTEFDLVEFIFDRRDNPPTLKELKKEFWPDSLTEDGSFHKFAGDLRAKLAPLGIGVIARRKMAVIRPIQDGKKKSVRDI
jgi:hypothetical protein